MKSVGVIQRRLVKNWESTKSSLQKLKSFASVRPEDGWSIFNRLNVYNDHVEFDVEPIVFNLPERHHHTTANLYVVIRGRLCIAREDSDEGPLVTRSFASEVGYFLRRMDRIRHLYGAHYDFVLADPGHPVFHAQLKSYCQLFEFVRDKFNIDGEPEDFMRGILSRVRVPCAQMDIFSLFLQLCADHLMGTRVGPEETRAFNELLKNNGFLRGAGSQSSRLASEAAVSCYRALHWYPTEMN